jgi:hypothetical protein
VIGISILFGGARVVPYLRKLIFGKKSSINNEA